jgi:hypothetical protein
VLTTIPADQTERLNGQLGPGRGVAELLADIRALLPQKPDTPASASAD